MTTTANIFDNMLENLAEADDQVLEFKEALHIKLNNFVVKEIEHIHKYLNQQWDDFNGEFVKRFKKNDEKNLSPEESARYLKETLSFLTPKNFVQLFDAIFNRKQLSYVHKRYEEVFSSFERNEDFHVVIQRHKVSEHFFRLFETELLKITETLKVPLKSYSEQYVNLLETFKHAKKSSSEDELLVFGAGVLGAIFAGPVGGFATREVLRASSSNQSKINQAILQFYDGLINLLEKIEVCLNSMYKRIVYIVYFLWYGFIKKVKADLFDLGYELTDVDFNSRELTIILKEKDEEELLDWYENIQKEAIFYLKEGKINEADVVSQHVAKFLNENKFLVHVNFKNIPIYYHGIILRYTVLMNRLEKLSKDKSQFQNCYKQYISFFTHFRYGMGPISTIEGFTIPRLSEVVMNFIYISEQLAMMDYDNAENVRLNTLKSLSYYIRNFSSKAVNEVFDAFPFEKIDQETLHLIAGYKVFLQSLGLNVPEDENIQRTIQNVTFEQILQLYHSVINDYQDETPFENFLQDNKLEVFQFNNSSKRMSNRDLNVRIGLIQHNEGVNSEENNEDVLLHYLKYDLREKVHLKLVEDTDKAKKDWFQEQKTKLYLLRADRNPERLNPEEKYLVGEMYFQGINTEADESEAYRWFLSSAEQGYLDAMKALVKFYSRRKEYDQACEWQMRVFDKTGDSEDQLMLGNLHLYFMRNFTEAYRLLFPLAEQGHIKAMKDLVTIYMEMDNKKAAFEWQLKIVELTEDIEDYYGLGLFYKEGYGTKADYNKAVHWLTKAAEKSHHEAMYLLGEIFEMSTSVRNHKEIALDWYRRAAKVGNEQAIQKVNELESFVKEEIAPASKLESKKVSKFLFAALFLAVLLYAPVYFDYWFYIIPPVAVIMGMLIGRTLGTVTVLLYVFLSLIDVPLTDFYPIIGFVHSIIIYYAGILIITYIFGRLIETKRSLSMKKMFYLIATIIPLLVIVYIFGTNLYLSDPIFYIEFEFISWYFPVYIIQVLSTLVVSYFVLLYKKKLHIDDKD